MRKIERENSGCMKPGQDLVVAGYAGFAGTAEIVRQRYTELTAWFSEGYLNRILVRDRNMCDSEWKDRDWKKYGATEVEPAGEGGIFAALWNLSGAYMTGIEFELRRIPVRQETIEICERYDLNPYRLDCGSEQCAERAGCRIEGCVLLVADNGGHLVRALKEDGIHAAVIGVVTDGIKRIIDNGEGKAYLTRPTEDEIYKILEVRL